MKKILKITSEFSRRILVQDCGPVPTVPAVPALAHALLAALVLCAPLAGGARAADVYIGVKGAQGQNVWPIGLPPISAERPGNVDDQRMGHQVLDVIRGDLLFSRRFKTIPPPSAMAAANVGEYKEDWKRAGAAFVVVAKASDIAPKVTLSVRLLDLASGEAILERYYRQDSRFWRSAAHAVADDIIKQLTGGSGFGRSQIAFINDQTGSKELYIIDYDGDSLRRLSSDRSIALLPRWAPNKRRIVYTSYKRNNPDLWEFDMESGKHRPILEHQGLNLAGGFSPDGTKIIVTMSKDKSPNLYLFDLNDRSLRQITKHFGVEASGTFSPDGAQVAFVSDRTGNPQVHTMDLATGRTQRLTRMNWCDSPAWSPSGEFVVFAGRAHPKDKMDIFSVDITGSQVRQLTHGEGSNEDPSWSPDGRFIAFTSTRDGKRKLYVMDSDGSAPHAIGSIPGNTYTPAWSP